MDRTRLPILTVAGVLLATIAPICSAMPVESLPLSDERIQNFSNGVAGGTFSCQTRGQYLASTQSLSQTGSCTNFGVTGTGIRRASGETAFFVEGWEASLDAIVDNDGNLVEGSFSLFGAIPDAGIGATTLLASGHLLDVYYGPVTAGNSLEVLIELTSVVSPLQDFGPLFLWRSFTDISEWNVPCSVVPGCAPWRVDAFDYDNYTGTEYRFLSRAVLVPSPASSLLLIVGLATLLATRRRPSSGLDPKAALV